MTSSAPPPAVAMLHLIVGRWVSAAVGVAAELRVADQFASGPRSVEDVAGALGAHPPTLLRVLRALASVGVFAEEPDGRYRNTALSEQLRSGPGSLRAFARLLGRPTVSKAWDDLLGSVVTGGSAFERVNGATLFDQCAADPALGEAFHTAMTARSAMELDAILAAFDARDVDTLVDVGGGHGLFLARVLERNPTQRGILFDLPEVVRGAGELPRDADGRPRVEVVPGDFFGTIPAGADGYVLKRILHDWSDEDARRILRRVHAAAPAGSRLFVLDAVIEAGNAPDFAKLLDLQMLVLLPGGRERTLPEWEAMLGEEGFALERVVPTAAPIAILEARRR